MVLYLFGMWELMGPTRKAVTGWGSLGRSTFSAVFFSSTLQQSAMIAAKPRQMCQILVPDVVGCRNQKVFLLQLH